jgi:heterodisulfide reductase subunit C/nitrate reductase gamma subunit
MKTEASREILWNIDNWYDVYLMYGLLVVAFALCAAGVYRRCELWLSGQSAEEHTGNLIIRFRDLFNRGLMQSGVVRDKLPALGHTLIYLGFIVLLFATTIVFIHHDLRIKIYQGEFYLAVTLLADLFGLAALMGCALLAYRRHFMQPDQLHSKAADSFFLAYIALLIVQGFLLEGLRIHATNDPWASYSPVGYLVAKGSWFLSERATREIHYAMWWFHTLTVYAALILLPYSKFFHILSSSLNLFFKRSGRPAGQLKPIGDIEEILSKGDEVTFGLGTIKDYTWKNLLDLDACTSCGRCQDACPAYNTGKPLSPKWLILDTRNHALALQSKGQLVASKLPSNAVQFDNLMLQNFLSTSGLNESEDSFAYDAGGSFRAQNALVQSSALKLGSSTEQLIAGEVIDPEVFWSCTTCYACVEACPVGIDHVDQIMGNRRNLALMRGEIPDEAQRTLRSLENRGNPYGAAEDRIKWTEGLSVPFLKPGSSVDILFWVGCVSSFDARKQKIAKALVQIFNRANLNYGILGSLENCTGDPARRLGEENLFQVLAKQNIKTLKSINF